jgi:hypothetical protein
MSNLFLRREHNGGRSGNVVADPALVSLILALLTDEKDNSIIIIGAIIIAGRIVGNESAASCDIGIHLVDDLFHIGGHIFLFVLLHNRV